jgi:hypothetical protein
MQDMLLQCDQQHHMHGSVYDQRDSPQRDASGKLNSCGSGRCSLQLLCSGVGSQVDTCVASPDAPVATIHSSLKERLNMYTLNWSLMASVCASEGETLW